jgi:hypothetical protein
MAVHAVGQAESTVRYKSEMATIVVYCCYWLSLVVTVLAGWLAMFGTFQLEGCDL